MDEIALWFNVLSFTVIFAALGLNYIRYLQEPRRWRLWYLWYQGVFAVYLLLATYTFFKIIFLHTIPPWVDSGLNWMRIFVSFALLVIAPGFIGRLSGKGWHWRYHLAALLTLAGMMTVLVFYPLPLISGMISACYNRYFLFITVLGLRIKPQARDIQGFLRISFFSFLLFTTLNLLSPFILTWLTGAVSTLAIGLFCALWGANDIACFALDWRKGESAAPVPGLSGLASRVEEWKISPRETEIIEAMAEGATNKEIAEKLFVSLRTVEAHLYNIYRKAGVKNRVELLHRLNSELRKNT